VLVSVVVVLGWAILTVINGFGGIMLWAVLAPIACVVLDILMRVRSPAPVVQPSPDAPRPAKFTAGLKPGMTYARIRHRRRGGFDDEPTPFVWRGDSHQTQNEQEKRSHKTRDFTRRRDR
jgi:hypothetical protein